jgi:hypothetical protein
MIELKLLLLIFKILKYTFYYCLEFIKLDLFVLNLTNHTVRMIQFSLNNVYYILF